MSDLFSNCNLVQELTDTLLQMHIGVEGAQHIDQLVSLMAHRVCLVFQPLITQGQLERAHCGDTLIMLDMAEFEKLKEDFFLVETKGNSSGALFRCTFVVLKFDGRVKLCENIIAAGTRLIHFFFIFFHSLMPGWIRWHRLAGRV